MYTRTYVHMYILPCISRTLCTGGKIEKSFMKKKWPTIKHHSAARLHSNIFKQLKKSSCSLAHAQTHFLSKSCNLNASEILVSPRPITPGDSQLYNKLDNSRFDNVHRRPSFHPVARRDGKTRKNWRDNARPVCEWASMFNQPREKLSFAVISPDVDEFLSPDSHFRGGTGRRRLRGVGPVLDVTEVDTRQT